MRGGRPTHLTQEVHDKIVAGVRAGLPLKYAAEAVGIAEGTVFEWLRRARDEDDRPNAEPFAKLANALKEAKAAKMREALENIAEAGREPRNWTANAWYLERADPEHFGAVTRAEAIAERRLREAEEAARARAERDPGTDLVTALTALPIAEQRQLLEALRQSVEGEEPAPDGE